MLHKYISIYISFYDGSALETHLASIVNTRWLHPSTFHVRILLWEEPGSGNVERLLREAPLFFEPVHLSHLVAEISRMLLAWASVMMSSAAPPVD